MSETLTKLRPDRDLQCYFQLPSAVAALSETSPTGFTVSGCWRQQFDWAVLEWNRDNVFEHPQLRNLPDGDLSAIVLTYQEQRTNCITTDSALYPTVDWPYLRIWADPGTGEQVYYVPLASYATPIGNATQAASAVFTLTGAVTAGDMVQLAWDTEHYYYILAAGDTIETAANNLAYAITSSSPTVSATVNGTSITLTVRVSAQLYSGSNGNRLGAYGTISGPGLTESWLPAAQQFSGGGSSPSTWNFALNFSSLTDRNKVPVPLAAMQNVRKLRWTYAADLQSGAYQRSEFSVVVSNWTVSGTGLTYSVAGPGSRRIENNAACWTPTGTWVDSPGNFSGGSISYNIQPSPPTNPTYTCQFNAERAFEVFIGTRMAANCGAINVSIDGAVVLARDLYLGAEDVLVRLTAGTIQAGSHTVTIQNTGASGSYLYFDFLELVVRSQQLPTFPTMANYTLATDWDTEHSMALAPERTAWLINKLGFTGRANHYAGALWFYELVRVGQVYASATVQFSGHADPNSITTISIGLAGSANGTVPLQHVHLYGDTLNTIAKSFELRLNSGYTSVWAQASGSTLRIQSRIMGSDGNNVTLAASTTSTTMTVTASSAQFTGGYDGAAGGVSDANGNQGWRTDLTAMPRLNRACRDWSKSFFAALKGYGIQATSALSMELQHGDPSTAASIAQRYPSGNPVIVNTPALQTNFSPTSLSFWQQAYADMAQIMVNAGQTPYLQFGEVQWWYFADDGSGLPFYDSYTQSQFTAKYGRAMAVITTNTADPASYPDETALLPTLIGSFTGAIMQFVRHAQPSTRFEVLYPPDTNNYAFTKVVNLPAGSWTPAALDCLKTENFTFTGDRDLVNAVGSIRLPAQLGFPPSKASHLVGISTPSTPWQKEAHLAAGAGVESVVLFALDQYCLIGYSGPAPALSPRSFMIP
jgi:hypothetical protein